MTASLTPQTPSTSRRALLTGAIGGIGFWVTGLLGRPQATRANDPNDVVLGSTNTATTTTLIQNTTNTNTVLDVATSGAGFAIEGDTVSGAGVVGTSTSGIGVYGTSTDGFGMQAGSDTFYALYAQSGSTDHPAVLGKSYGHFTGVQGVSGFGATPGAKAKTGIYGYAAQDANSRGVWGESPAGHAVQGTSSSGYAGYFAGKVFTSKFYELKEISNPAAPTTNRARLFVRDNGAGKTQLCVRFEFGAIQVISTQL